MNLHIGKLFAGYFRKNARKKKELAQHLGLHFASVSRYENNASITTQRLIEISTFLRHNFFLDIGFTLPQDFTTNANPYELYEQRIAALEKALEIVTVERNILLKSMGK
jgi:transcriptional regulator with XRE-family HTH domain